MRLIFGLQRRPCSSLPIQCWFNACFTSRFSYFVAACAATDRLLPPKHTLRPSSRTSGSVEMQPGELRVWRRSLQALQPSWMDSILLRTVLVLDTNILAKIHRPARGGNTAPMTLTRHPSTIPYIEMENYFVAASVSPGVFSRKSGTRLETMIGFLSTCQV